MTEPGKQKFLVMYLVPASVLDQWRQTEPADREPAEQKMQSDWRQWMNDHRSMIVSTEVGGATKLVTPTAVSDTKNDITLFSFIEAGSHEEAAKAFEDHPHLRIPQSSIQVMSIRPLAGM